MNKAKITIKNDKHECIARFGLLVNEKNDYTSEDLITILTNMIDEIKSLEAQAEKPLDPLQKYVALGWQFKEIEFYHPHKGDTWTEQHFRSPRMKDFYEYTSVETLKQAEAKVVARMWVKQLLNNYTGDYMQHAFEQYCLEFPNAHHAPEIKIELL